MRTLTCAGPLLLLAACTASNQSSTTPVGGPRGLRASEHREVAARQAADENQRQEWPSTGLGVSGAGPAQSDPVAMPWYRSWSAGTEHARLATIHRSQADALDQAYADACGERSAAEVSISPLVRYGIGGWNTTSGVIVYLSSAAPAPDRLLADLKCHRAYMMLAPSGMDDCPLDLPGLALDARGDSDGVTVSITLENRALIPELQRRAAHEREVEPSRAP